MCWPGSALGCKMRERRSKRCNTGRPTTQSEGLLPLRAGLLLSGARLRARSTGACLRAATLGRTKPERSGADHQTHQIEREPRCATPGLLLVVPNRPGVASRKWAMRALSPPNVFVASR
jgi:hypothetical protein